MEEKLLEDNIFDKIHDVDLKKTMEESYIDYAMSVIASRAFRMSEMVKAGTETYSVLHE